MTDQIERIQEAETELKQAQLEERDRYMDYLEAQQKKFVAEQKLKEARYGSGPGSGK